MATPPAPQGSAMPGPAWTITGQTEVTQPDASGRYVSGVRVTFQTSGGQQGSVFVPDTAYNADNVKAAVDARARQMWQVAQLGSGH